MLGQLGTALAGADAPAAAVTLDDDVTLRVAVHDQPFQGLHAAKAILEVLLDGPLHTIEAGDCRSADMTGDDTTATEVLTFTAGVVGYEGRADGLLLAHHGATGRIADVTVYLRPLAALAALADEMGRRMGAAASTGSAQ